MTTGTALLVAHATRLGLSVTYLVNIAVGPNQGNLPFNGTLLDIASGLMFTAFALCVVGLIVAGAMMGIGQHFGNYMMHDKSKTAALWVVIGAIITGSSSALINWASNLNIH